MDRDHDGRRGEKYSDGDKMGNKGFVRFMCKITFPKIRDLYEGLKEKIQAKKMLCLWARRYIRHRR